MCENSPYLYESSAPRIEWAVAAILAAKQRYSETFGGDDDG